MIENRSKVIILYIIMGNNFCSYTNIENSVNV